MDHDISEETLKLRLHKHFGFGTFRPHQEEIIRSIMKGKDTIAVLPTGAGKSVCYQLPGLLLGNLTLVISPLLSLMADQVSQLIRKGIAATTLNSSIAPEERKRIQQAILNHQYTFLYLSPEMLQSSWMKQHEQQLLISLVVIDEAHCISEWGHHFRPEYLDIQAFLHRLPARPRIAAFTASATPTAIKDISAQLGAVTPAVFRQSALRENLAVRIIPVVNKTQQYLFLMRTLRRYAGQACIIYGATRQTTEGTTRLLQDHGFSASAYHGGLDSTQRARIQDDFIQNRVQIICATNAFGMGVDKPDIRCVIHLAHPATVESYYQEVGRAGRDGQLSSCYLLTLPSDAQLHIDMIEQSYPPLQLILTICSEYRNAKVHDPISIHHIYQKLHTLHSVYELKSAVKWGVQLGFWEHSQNQKILRFLQPISTIKQIFTRLSRHRYIQLGRLRDIAALCQKKVCRMRQFVLYFEPQANHKTYKSLSCGRCDICVSDEKDSSLTADHATKIQFLERMKQLRVQHPSLKLYTLPQLASFYAVVRSENIPGFGRGLRELIGYDEGRVESSPSKTAQSFRDPASSRVALRSRLDPKAVHQLAPRRISLGK